MTAAYGAVLLYALTVVASAAAFVAGGAGPALAALALGLFVAGTGAFFLGLGLALREVWRSPRSLAYEAERVLALGGGPGRRPPGPPA